MTVSVWPFIQLYDNVPLAAPFEPTDSPLLNAIDYISVSEERSVLSGEVAAFYRKTFEINNRLAALSNSPKVDVLRVIIESRAARPFGSEFVPPAAVTAYYLRSAAIVQRSTLLDVSRSLRTWRRQQRFWAFNDLFSSLRQLTIDEFYLPLMLRALSESYRVRNELPQRDDFRMWLSDAVGKVWGAERSQSIFGSFQ